VEVVAHSKSQILHNFAGYLPITLLAGLVYFAFGTPVVVWLLEDHLPNDQVKPVSAIATALLVVVSGVLYVWFVVSSLSRSRLALEEGTLVIRGQTSIGFVERRYAIGDLESVVFGEQLNAVERVMDKLHQLGVPKSGSIGLVKDLKAGWLLVIEKTGGHEVFHFVDKVFAADALVAFAVELARHGVKIGSSGS
jgi:hypothetical protein